MVNDGNCNYGEIPVNMTPNNGVYHIRDGPSVLWYNHQWWRKVVNSGGIISKQEKFSMAKN